ncbi:MAG: hypothetical protein HYS81_03650 [Candidatus Aenigmatarchaeota archaeon]|nr:MAG: hypothetical protein HYS81_03650 [Candidatus Aenigmarchaeota archaeon]
MKGNIAIIGVAVVLLTAGAFFVTQNRPDTQAMPETMEGLHWHPTLAIFINDEPYPVPAGVGITLGNNVDNDVSGMRMSPIHTHDASGVLHMEQPYPREDTVTLGYFFKVWGARFDETCVIDWCNDGTRDVKMFVNGERNYEFGSYRMQDGDEIEIRYDEGDSMNPQLT